MFKQITYFGRSGSQRTIFRLRLNLSLDSYSQTNNHITDTFYLKMSLLKFEPVLGQQIFSYKTYL